MSVTKKMQVPVLQTAGHKYSSDNIEPEILEKKPYLELRKMAKVKR